MTSSDEEVVDLLDLVSRIKCLSPLAVGKLIDIVKRSETETSLDFDEFEINFSKLKQKTIHEIKSFVENNLIKRKRRERKKKRKIEFQLISKSKLPNNEPIDLTLDEENKIIVISSSSSSF